MEVVLKNKYGLHARPATLILSAEGPDADDAVAKLAEVIEGFDVDD